MKPPKNKSLASWSKFWLCAVPLISACSQAPERSVSQMGQQVWDCFTEQKRNNLDARLTPCINAITTPRTATLKKSYSRQDSATVVNAMIAKESGKVSEVLNNLIISCDTFGSEVETMYDKWYPVDTSSINLNIIEKLNDNFQKLSVSNTVNKEILNELIARNIKARKLKEGLKRCQQMKQLYKNEGSAYFASAFIYNLQKKYPFAIVELQQEIAVSNDKDLNLIIGVIKRKARRDKILID